MASGKYILQELTDEGGRNPRLEIDEFLLDNDMTNLFLLALSNIQKDSLKPFNGQMNLLNFYALAGIHGAPREEWSGVPNRINYGYCHHSRATFPLWHRPYIKLYETAIYLEMVEQAKLFKDPNDRQKYSQAAQRYRLPYWDPIMPRHNITASQRPEEIWGYPTIFAQKTVYLKTPASPIEFVEIGNPLYEFRFPNSAEYSMYKRKPLNQSSQLNPTKTVRCPNVRGETDNNAIKIKIQRQANSLASGMWKLLAPAEQGGSGDRRPWDTFATTQVTGDFSEGGSIEAWHNTCHNIFGSSIDRFSKFAGQMGDGSVAGFDPIFWMHHNNVDRLLALHQALYGQNIEGPELKAELYPFLKDDTKCFTSDDGMVKNYFSPGFAVPGSKPVKEIKRLVQKYLTDNYYWAIVGSNNRLKPLANWPKDLSGSKALYGTKASSSITTSSMEMTSLAFDVEQNPVLVFRTAAVDQLTDTDAATDVVLASSTILENAKLTNEAMIGHDVSLEPELREALLSQVWDVHIKVRKFAFNGTFSVHIFIGDVEDDHPELFFTKKNEAGFLAVFTTPEEQAVDCEGCKKSRADDLIEEDVVPLSNYLFDYLESNPKSDGLITEGTIRKISSLDSDQVVPFLKEHLKWRMVDLHNNLLVGREEEARLEVTVTNRAFTPPNTEHLMGIYGPVQIHEEITRGTPGGRGYMYPPAEL